MGPSKSLFDQGDLSDEDLEFDAEEYEPEVPEMEWDEEVALYGEA